MSAERSNSSINGVGESQSTASLVSETSLDRLNNKRAEPYTPSELRIVKLDTLTALRKNGCLGDDTVENISQRMPQGLADFVRERLLSVEPEITDLDEISKQE